MSTSPTLNCLSRWESLRPVFFRKKRRPKASAKPNRLIEQHSDEDENCAAVGMEQNGFIGGHEFQLVEEPESIAQQDDDSEKHSVGDQLNASSSRKYVMVIPSGLMGMSSFGTCVLNTKTKFAV